MNVDISRSLRETIVDKIAESDGCYLMIYSGPSEKLSFLSSLLQKRKNDLGVRLLIDFNLRHYANLLNCEGCILVDNMKEKSADETPESYCLKIIRQNVLNYGGPRAGLGRIIVVAECSSFPSDTHGTLTNGIISLHKQVIDLTNSIKGGTILLLYNLDALDDELLSNFLELHRGSSKAPRNLSLQVLRQELLERTRASLASPGIFGRDEGVLFLDPVAHSGAFIMPTTDKIREVLPHDPLDMTHRDIAFTNNYTAHEKACPYFSSDVPSHCLLDPNVVMAERTRGVPFVGGHPCQCAVDYMVAGEKPEKREKTRQDGNGEESEN